MFPWSCCLSWRKCAEVLRFILLTKFHRCMVCINCSFSGDYCGAQTNKQSKLCPIAPTKRAFRDHISNIFTLMCLCPPRNEDWDITVPHLDKKKEIALILLFAKMLLQSVGFREEMVSTHKMSLCVAQQIKLNQHLFSFFFLSFLLSSYDVMNMQRDLLPSALGHFRCSLCFSSRG